jgi:hypothetical protein
LFETANGRSVGSLAFTRSIWSTVSGIQMNLFETGMENHLNDADFFQLVSNSRQVGVWKDDITGCRWVLLGLWWISSPCVVMVRIYKVLAFNRRFGSFDKNFLNTAEQMRKFHHQRFGEFTRFCLYQAFWEVWWDSLIIAEQTGTFRHQWFGDINVLPRFHGDPSWKNICKGVWTS